MAMKREASATTTAFIVDGSYAHIQARTLGGKIDFVLLRAELENLASTEFGECWYFDSQRSDARGDSALASEYHALKYARPLGPQFQVEIFSTKKHRCRCTKCGHNFSQNIQKGVDNGIATKLVTLALVNRVDRFILFSGDGDFYTTLGFLRNQLLKEIWVVGYQGSVSGDLQQLASRIIWINDMWERVQCREGPFRGFGAGSRSHVPPSFTPRVVHRSSKRSLRANRRDSLERYGPARRRSRTLSPRRDASAEGCRPLSPLRGAAIPATGLFEHGDMPIFDVHFSGSDDDVFGSLSASSCRSEHLDAEDTQSSSIPVTDLTAPASSATPFPLPMAVPVTSSTPSTRSIADRPRRVFEWAFGDS